MKFLSNHTRLFYCKCFILLHFQDMATKSICKFFSVRLSTNYSIPTYNSYTYTPSSHMSFLTRATHPRSLGIFPQEFYNN